jgi:hypothetical protein
MKGTKTMRVGWDYYVEIWGFKVVVVRPLERSRRLRPSPPQKPQPIPMHYIFNVLLFITPLR